MGSVATPSDIRRGRRRVVEELAKDLDPARKSALMDILASWKGEESEKELEKLLGKEAGRRMAKRFRS